jgi:hypothetical protein
MTDDEELERIWKEAVKALSWNLLGWTEENHENLTQDR